MSNSFYKISSYLAITGFLFYWMIIFILTVPSGFTKKNLGDHVPLLRNLLSNSWKLFSPPPTYNYRLYFFVRDTNNRQVSDTLEMLAPLSLQKQRHAPFNQPENILDQLVNNNVIGLMSAVWGNRVAPPAEVTDSMTSSEISVAVEKVENSEDYRRCLGTLINYCSRVLKERNIDSRNRELKIVVTKKMIRPFEEMTNINFLPKEHLFFETSYITMNK